MSSCGGCGDAYNLDCRATLYVRSLSTASYNEQVEVFTPGLTLWAAKKDATIGEKARAHEIAASLTTFFTVRSSSETRAIKAQDRLECDGVTYNIIGTREIKRNEWLEIQTVVRNDAI